MIARATQRWPSESSEDRDGAEALRTGATPSNPCSFLSIPDGQGHQQPVPQGNNSVTLGTGEEVPEPDFILHSGAPAVSPEPFVSHTSLINFGLFGDNGR